MGINWNLFKVTIVPNPERVPALNGMDWLIRIENAATGSKFEGGEKCQ